MHRPSSAGTSHQPRIGSAAGGGAESCVLEHAVRRFPAGEPRDPGAAYARARSAHEPVIPLRVVHEPGTELCPVETGKPLRHLRSARDRDGDHRTGEPTWRDPAHGPPPRSPGPRTPRSPRERGSIMTAQWTYGVVA